jgi:nucleolar protein 15
MVKKQVNAKPANSKAQEKKVEKVKVEEKVEEVEEHSIPDDSSLDDEQSEQVAPDSNENQKSRFKAVEKNIEALETIDRNTGVIYLGHLPWGFDDIGIKKYFEQFGKITRILVPRSRKVNYFKIKK